MENNKDNDKEHDKKSHNNMESENLNTENESEQEETRSENKEVSGKETSEIFEEKTKKIRKLKPFTFVIIGLFVLLIGSLFGAINYMNNIIQNNLMINHRIDETNRDVLGIQTEQARIKEAIKPFQNISAALETLSNTVNNLNKELPDLRNEVKVLHNEIKKKQDLHVARQIQVDETPTQMTQPTKLEVQEKSEAKEKTSIKEESDVSEQPDNQKKDVRNKVIKFIEDKVQTTIGKIVSFFKEKLLKMETYRAFFRKLSIV